jgi:ubiquinone/menaquinone biosynthesis C-methylase UbiE
MHPKLLEGLKPDRADRQDESFDVVTCQYGLMFIMDHAAAMREAARVLRPGGLLAATVYGTEQQMQQVRSVNLTQGNHTKRPGMVQPKP